VLLCVKNLRHMECVYKWRFLFMFLEKNKNRKYNNKIKLNLIKYSALKKV
jgi:hypothetical protein